MSFSDFINIIAGVEESSSPSIKGVINMANKSPRETGGPLVKTGPTAGQNRSRNKNGQWRRKRSDAGTKRAPNNK